MLKRGQLDPDLPVADQLKDGSDEPVVLVNLFDCDPSDAEHFKAAWIAVSKAQPNFLSAQLHRGIGGSRMWLNYSVFDNVAAFAATAKAPEFMPLNGVYPDSATARPHLFRRVAIPGICTGRI